MHVQLASTAAMHVEWTHLKIMIGICSHGGDDGISFKAHAGMQFAG